MSVAMLIGGLFVGLAACGGGDRELDLAGYQSDPLPAVDVAELPDLSTGGEPFRFVAPAGGLLLVYFGYTNCPDACPATMGTIDRALGELGDDAGRVSVAMVTVDPDRDTEVLTDYVQSFVPGGHAIATDDEPLLRDVALAFGAEFDVDARSPDNVKVGHTTHLYAVDDTGHLVITWPVNTTADDLVGDMRQLMDV